MNLKKGINSILYDIKQVHARTHVCMCVCVFIFNDNIFCCCFLCVGFFAMVGFAIFVPTSIKLFNNNRIKLFVLCCCAAASSQCITIEAKLNRYEKLWVDRNRRLSSQNRPKIKTNTKSLSHINQSISQRRKRWKRKKQIRFMIAYINSGRTTEV